MKSLASLALILAAPAAAAQEPAVGEGPRGSSQLAVGETRYDNVGRAEIAPLAGVAVATPGLPAGGFAEVTSLDTGRTIVAMVVAGEVPTGRIAILSPAAAAALSASGVTLAVRVRASVATPPEVTQLRAGGTVAARVDAPPALLAALRKKLAPEAPAKPPAAPVAPRALPKPIAPPPPSPRVAAKPVAPRTGYVVQVAAVSNAARAAALARSLGGSVDPGPPLWRVRLGPYADAAAAARAKADVARRGHPGATIIRLP